MRHIILFLFMTVVYGCQGEDQTFHSELDGTWEFYQSVADDGEITSIAAGESTLRFKATGISESENDAEMHGKLNIKKFNDPEINVDAWIGGSGKVYTYDQGQVSEIFSFQVEDDTLMLRNNGSDSTSYARKVD